MISKYQKTINKEVEKSNFWPTFTDLICSILMVVTLLLFSSESLQGSVEKDIAEKINDSIKEVINVAELGILIDENSGQITFDESTMFDLDSAELKPEAKEMLKKFIPTYIETIYSNYEKNIEKIVVKGHTDDTGSYLYNLDLSQQRALNVVRFMVSDEIGEYKYKDKVLKDVEAIGRSKAELIYNEDNSVNKEASRRVEIKYELKFD